MVIPISHGDSHSLQLLGDPFKNVLGGTSVMVGAVGEEDKTAGRVGEGLAGVVRT